MIKLAKRKAEILEDFGTADDAAAAVDEASTTAGIDLVSGIVRDWAKRRKLDDTMDVDGAQHAVDARAMFDSLKSDFEAHRAELESNAWVQKVLLA